MEQQRKPPRPSSADNDLIKQLRKPTLWQLWRSLPRASKLFLAVCVMQGCIGVGFSAEQLTEALPEYVQDLYLILVSSICSIYLVCDAFVHENGYQLLVCMASGAINLVQLVLYATLLSSDSDNIPLIVTCCCAVLQAIAIALARYAYAGFGWRMYSKIACNQLLPDAEKQRSDGLRLHRFSALAKLDAQLIALMLVVGLVNGINPGQGSTTPVLTGLLAAAAVGCTVAAAWLAACWFAVIKSWPRLRLAAEFCHPVSYILAGAYIMSGPHYGNLGELGQLHGEAALVGYAVVFIVGTMAVWWDARLVASDIRANIGVQAKNHQNGDRECAQAGGPGGAGIGGGTTEKIPQALFPLVQGAWLMKLPSGPGQSIGSSPSKKGAFLFTPLMRKGRWRFFQLSHDGSTLRWDWRKYVLLLHVEDIVSCPEDLTITLRLTLEPDLRLRFPNAVAHEAWTKGLKLLLRLLGNPDGLNARQMVLPLSHQTSLKRTESLATDPGSPSRILQRLTTVSHRASAAGLLTPADLEFAAERARRALRTSLDDVATVRTSDNTTSDDDNKHNSTKDEKRNSLIGGSSDVGSDKYHKGDIEAFGGDGGLATDDIDGDDIKKARTPSHNGGAPVIVVHASTPGSKVSTAQQPFGSFSTRSAMAAGGTPSPAGNRENHNNTRGGRAVQWLRTIVSGTSLQDMVPVRLRSITAAGSTNTIVPTGAPQILRTTSSLPRTSSTASETTTTRGLTRSEAAMAAGILRTISGTNNDYTYSNTYHYTSGGDRDRSVRFSGGGSIHNGTNPNDFGSSCGLPPLVGRHSRQSSLHTDMPVPELMAVDSAVYNTNDQHQVYNGGVVVGSSLLPGVAEISAAERLMMLHHGGSGGPPMSWTLAQQQQQMPFIPGSSYDSGIQQQQYHRTTRLYRENSNASSWNGGNGAVGQTTTPTSSRAAQHASQQQYKAGTWPYMGLWGVDGAASARSPHGASSMLTTPMRGSTFNVEIVDYSELSIGRLLGEGAEGPVHAAWFRDTPVAVKRTHSSTEVDIHLHAGSHDNVVSLRAVCYRGEYTYLVMELCPRGTLDVLIHSSSSTRLDPLKLLPIVRSIARGMLHLHTRSPSIMHRDLKPGNVFIGHGFVAKIGDFGMARLAADTRYQRAAAFNNYSEIELQRTLTPGVIGTAAYCAPELMQQETPREGGGAAFDPEMLKADVYSFGVLLWELVERKRPYAEMDHFQIQTQWLMNQESMRLPPVAVPENLSPAAKHVMKTLAELITACTAWEPSQRPTFKAILSKLRAVAAEASEKM